VMAIEQERQVQVESFVVANVKCGGCASTITTGLQGLAGVHDVQVDVASGRVDVAGDTLNRDILQNKLAQLGYPVR